MSEQGAPRRSSRNAGKPSETSPAATTSKRKVEGSSSTVESKKAKAPTVKPVVSKSDGGKQLKVGDVLPKGLKLKTQSGDEVDVSSLRKTVLFSYPRANTSGCTTQAKLFRDSWDDFKTAGYKVYGISNDSPSSLKSWKDKQSLQYDLLSDPRRELIEKLTGSNDKTRRSHFVIDQDGKLTLISLSVKPPESSRDALAFITK